jgi:hypothetical protein
MANAYGRSIDNTHLSIDTAEERYLVHRDYLGHCLRWSHILKRLAERGIYKQARVLDIGCGVDIPMARLMYSNRFIPTEYVGLDYNKDDKFKAEMFERGKFPINTYGRVDFASKQILLVKPTDPRHQIYPLVYHVDGESYEGDHLLPNIYVCLEVIEHVEPSHTHAMLFKIKQMMEISQTAYAGNDQLPVMAFISTPCYDAKTGAAGNHVSEITRNALGALLEDIGFNIIGNYGTFASQTDYKTALHKTYPELDRYFERLKEYYDSNVIAILHAPLFPEHARNNIWVLGVGNRNYKRRFDHLTKIRGPWTSSKDWEQLASMEHYKGYELGI